MVILKVKKSGFVSLVYHVIIYNGKLPVLISYLTRANFVLVSLNIKSFPKTMQTLHGVYSYAWNLVMNLICKVYLFNSNTKFNALNGLFSKKNFRMINPTISTVFKATLTRIRDYVSVLTTSTVFGREETKAKMTNSLSLMSTIYFLKFYKQTSSVLHWKETKFSLSNRLYIDRRLLSSISGVALLLRWQRYFLLRCFIFKIILFLVTNEKVQYGKSLRVIKICLRVIQ